MGSWDKSGGCLLIGPMVSGIKVARARSGRWHGTWEPLALEQSAWVDGAGERERSKQRKL